MIYRLTLTSLIVMVFVASLLANRRMDDPLRPEVTPLWQCRRIVSMAPSITETLYALGLGDCVVGVTRYCEYPPQAKKKPRIGGYFDPNFEAIVALKPDLVIMLDDHEQSLPGFERLKLETLVVSHRTVDGIINSFRTIGRVCGRGIEGRRMAREYENRLARIHAKTRGLPRPSVLFALDRTCGSGHLTDVYIAGVDQYFDRMIELAGGQNAYKEHGVRNPVVSPEGIMSLNPDVIVDLAPKEVLEQTDRQAILEDWNELGQVSAVKNHRVLVFDQDYAFIPGPRFVHLVEDLARAIHPEVTWEENMGTGNPESGIDDGGQGSEN
jgi:iron complex transport system substrate-binding protein